MSRWLKSTSFVDDFFPDDRSRPCYGFYSPAIDRLIFVNSKDLFLSLQAAILFSSKLTVLVIAFDSTRHPVDNSTCYFWAPDTRVPQSAYHLPQIFPTAPNQKSLVYRGASPHVPEEKILKAQEYLAFVIQASHALYLAESIHNVNEAEIYEKFFPEFKSPQTPARSRFHQIEKILYQFDDIDAARNEIDDVLSGQLDAVSRRRYYARFNYLLYGQPTPRLK